jgi:hypothetical protein
MPDAGSNQSATVQNAESMLHSALRQPGFLRNLAMAEPHTLTVVADGVPPKKEVHDERCRAVVMTHQVAEQDVGNVLIEPEGRHPAIVVTAIAVFKLLYRVDGVWHVRLRR